jgi:hypothetical protein
MVLMMRKQTTFCLCKFRFSDKYHIRTIYTAWNNNSATLHGVVIFFTKSNDGGKTFANTMVLSPPNTNPKKSVLRENVSIGASGSHVVVTWWTNETGDGTLQLVLKYVIGWPLAN